MQKVRSETEIINHHFINLLSFQLYSVLCRNSFHVNRLKGNSRADVLTSATTNTYLRPDLGDGERSLVGNHVYRLCGTVFGAGTAACFIVVYNAVLDDELYLSHLGVVLLLFGQWKDGAGRAHLPTNGAVVIAEAILFFATPDILSGLCTWAFFDNNSSDAVTTQFASGCAAIVTFAINENRKNGNRCFLGMFDPSARPLVPENELTFTIPMCRFKRMMETMNDSALFQKAFTIVKKRINKIK